MTEKGGISIKNETEGGFFAVLGAFAKKISLKILKGKFNIFTMQRPTLLGFPETHVQVLGMEYAMMTKYLRLASLETDPLEQMKLIVTGIVTIFSINAFRI